MIERTAVSTNGEIKILADMLTATREEDKKRLRNIGERLIEISEYGDSDKPATA